MQRSSLCAPQKLLSQTNNPAACIQDQRVRTYLHFNTRCVPSMAYRGRPRCRITSSSPPKTNQKTLHLGHLTCSCRSLTLKSDCTYYILSRLSVSLGERWVLRIAPVITPIIFALNFLLLWLLLFSVCFLVCLSLRA